MRLNEAFCDCKPETHSRSVAVDAHKIFKYFLMVLCRYSGPGIRYRDFDAIGTR